MKQHMKPWIGEWLREQRVASGLEAKDVAAKLNVHPSNITRRESGEQHWRANDIPVVLPAYGISPQRFAAKVKEMTP